MEAILILLFSASRQASTFRHKEKPLEQEIEFLQTLQVLQPHNPRIANRHQRSLIPTLVGWHFQTGIASKSTGRVNPAG